MPTPPSTARNWLGTTQRLDRLPPGSSSPRHSYAINALRAGMPEQVLKIIGGWRKIPETYFRTLGEEDAIGFHRQISPGDRLGKAVSSRKGRQLPGPLKGRL